MTFPVHTPTQLGRVLRGRRKALELSQQQAAAAVGLLAKTVSKLERDPGTATIESLFKLLSALGLEVVIQPKDRKASAREW